jgi:hypothetical protein
MLASFLNCINEVNLVTFNAYDVRDFCRLNMADIVLEEFIVGENLSITIRHHIKEVDAMF